MYECTVVAVDKGTPPRTGTASIRIRMANVNDEAPVFSQTMYDSFPLSVILLFFLFATSLLQSFLESYIIDRWSLNSLNSLFLLKKFI